jgi:hypothetical protein
MLSKVYIDEDTETQNDMIQLLSSLAFAGVAWILYFHGGGTDAWPTILPLALIQAFTTISYIAAKNIGLRKIIQRVDGFITTLSVVFFSGLVLYSIIPQQERWAQHMGALLCVFLGLPLAYTLPSILRQKQLPQTIEKTEVWNALLASGLVYSRETSPQFQEVEFIHDQGTGARCGVYVDTNIESKTIYVAFAGSDSKVDWLRTNLAVETESYTSCHAFDGTPIVHRGFLNAWRSIREPVWKKIADLVVRQGGSGKIVVCGHSLGGATATLAALDIACQVEKQYLDTLTVVTFGSPRVGNKDFKVLFNRVIPRSVRVSGIYDPVPKFVINDFVHVDRELVVASSAHIISSYKKALLQKIAS